MQGIRTKEDILNDIECTEDDIRDNKRRLVDIEEEISNDEDLLDTLKKELEKVEELERRNWISEIAEINAKEFWYDIDKLSSVEKSLLDFKYHNQY